MRYRVVERDLAAGIFVVEFHDGTMSKMLNVGIVGASESDLHARASVASPALDQPDVADISGEQWRGVVTAISPPVAGTYGATQPFEYSFNAGGSLPEHKHPFAHGHRVINGRTKVVVAGQMYELGPGEEMEMPANILHSITALEDNTKFINTVVKD